MADAVPSIPRPVARANRSAGEILGSEDFRALVKKRWSVSLVLLVALFVTYYGFILLVGLAKDLATAKVGEVTTVAIPLGIAVIVIAWGLTAFYVSWANRTYDPEVERLKGQLTE